MEASVLWISFLCLFLFVGGHGKVWEGRHVMFVDCGMWAVMWNEINGVSVIDHLVLQEYRRPQQNVQSVV